MPGKKKKEINKEALGGSRIEERKITEELQDSYIDYAMSVIVSRALPDIRDGLKPVHRRILWSMWDMGLKSDAKFVKSARVVGETLGKYHPHGDSAVYDSMVRMAQDFSLRYPLIKGQGNFGNIDGDSAAAQRYTEARLSKISEEMLKDIEKETVEWQLNYDNSREEPRYLPAAFPNLLVNGTMGIAVGMATNIPPHNLGEVTEALVYLSKNPDASVKELMNFVPAPDFPTGGIIYGKEGLEEAYATGRGSITVRAIAEIEEGGEKIVINEIPYQVVKSSLIEKIASLIQNKKIEGIKDIRDESDRDGLRFVIELKRGVNPDRVLNNLFKHTDLQKNFYFNMVALVDGIQPQTVSLKDILSAYLGHKKDVVKKRIKFDLRKAEERAHILEGLVKALSEIDKVIATIKKSKDRPDAHAKLVKGFSLTAIQADAILEMRLQSLASLETEKIKDELKEKLRIIKEFRIILKSESKIAKVATDELEQLAEKFNDERRTKIANKKLKSFQQEDFIPKEEAVIILTQDGYIKRLPPGFFKSQGRGGKGLIGFDLKDEDKIHILITANTHDVALFFTNKGRIYKSRVYEIPKTSRSGKGKLVHTFLGLSNDENITALVTHPNNKESVGASYLTMLTKKGTVKKTALSEFENIRSNGIAAITLGSGDELRWVRITSGKDEVIAVSESGRSIRFKEKDIRPMGRTARGVKAIRLKKDDFVAGIGIIKEGSDGKKDKLLVVMENGYGKQTLLKEFRAQRRGGSGITAAKTSKKTGKVITASVVNSEAGELLALSAKGKVIRTELKSIRASGRATQGVKIMRLDEGDFLVGVVCL